MKSVSGKEFAKILEQMVGNYYALMVAIISMGNQIIQPEFPYQFMVINL
jgi:hypothetical protein